MESGVKYVSEYAVPNFHYHMASVLYSEAFGDADWGGGLF